MPKVKIPSELYEQARQTAQQAGYSSVDEFVAHLLETTVARTADAAGDPDVLKRLRGLGYIS
ncbi:hypothetical protein ACFL55_01640 [Candidatus Latescibacterota bacterium]